MAADESRRTLDDVVSSMDRVLEGLVRAGDERQHFLATYRRTTAAIGADLESDRFVDPDWLERWDVAFADLHVEAIERWDRGEPVAGPWAVAFEASRDHELPPLRHVLLALNAHVNYDLPLSLLATVTDEEFADPDVVARKNLDHKAMDGLLAARVKIEDEELKASEEPGDRTLLDRMLAPFNQAATKRFLEEAREKCWANAIDLSSSRGRGPEEFDARLGQLEELCRERVADLRQPGQVLLRLARRGFGVRLPP